MQQLIQLLVVVLVIGAPIIGKLLQWLSEQKKLKEREKAVELARLESLRTGRPLATLATPPATQTPQSPSERMQELARRRQEQLQELRRRQQAARQQQPQTRAAPSAPRTPVPRPTGSRPMPVPQSVPRPTQRPPAPRPAVPGRPASTPAQRRPTPRPTMQPKASSGPGAVAQKTGRHAAPDPHPESPAPSAEARPLSVPAEMAAPKPVSLLGQVMTPADWRRLIIAREVLDLPLALREPEEGAPAAW